MATASSRHMANEQKVRKALSHVRFGLGEETSRVEAEKRDGRTGRRRDACSCKIEPDTYERKEGNSHVRYIAEDAGFRHKQRC